MIIIIYDQKKIIIINTTCSLVGSTILWSMAVITASQIVQVRKLPGGGGIIVKKRLFKCTFRFNNIKCVEIVLNNGLMNLKTTL